MGKVLDKKFFNDNALKIAPKLLGKFLVIKKGEVVLAKMITEVEAYDGPEDLASHASLGRRTKRNEIMYKHGGFWYVYLVYGMHYMLNVVTGEEDYPSAILIRGVDGVCGPGRVTKFFGVGMDFNNQLAGSKSGLFIEDRGVSVPKEKILKTPRIGVAYAGEVWSKKKYRFLLKDLVI